MSANQLLEICWWVFITVKAHVVISFRWKIKPETIYSRVGVLLRAWCKMLTATVHSSEVLSSWYCFESSIVEWRKGARDQKSTGRGVESSLNTDTVWPVWPDYRFLYSTLNKKILHFIGFCEDASPKHLKVCTLTILWLNKYE